jgi:glycosyltransferase involved in cell wall biosynthesis
MADSVCIAHAENIGQGSGGTIRVASLAKELVKAGFEVHLVAPKPRSNTEIPDQLSEVEIHTVPITSKGTLDQIPRALAVSWQARKVAKKHDAILQVERGTLAGFVALMGETDYALDLHDIGFNGPLYQDLPLAPIVTRFVEWMERRGVQKANEVIAVSEPMRDFVEEGWEATNTAVIHNGVRPEILQYGSEKSIKPESKEVAFIGNLNDNIAYEKFCLLAKEIEDIQVHVIGDGFERSTLESLVDAHDVENVEIHGFLPDEEAYRILMRAEVCIFPLEDTHHTRMAQHMKGFDYSALSKAIATDRDGTANILESYDAALISDPGVPQEFVENTRELLNDEKKRDRLGKRARKVAEQFTWDNQAKKLVELLQDRK